MRSMSMQLKLWVPIILWRLIDQVLQDVAAESGPNPAAALLSPSDANLMFEFLMGGVEINQDNNVFLLDEELASMRKGREFLSRINDGIPKDLSSMELMAEAQKAHLRTPLIQDEFDHMVLSMVYSALQAGVQRSPEKREAWGGVLLQLANITTYELRGSFLFNYA